MAWRRVSSRGMTVGLVLVELLDDALVVLLNNVLGNALHAEDFDVQSLAVRERILNASERLFVDLVHVDGETYSSKTLVRYCAMFGDGREEAKREVLRIPPAVFSRFPHRSHLKCFAF